MADPEQLLGALPEESPPPEIVLAAVRVFRYRALAVAAIGTALVVAGAFVLQQVNVNGQFPVKVATARVRGGIYSGEGVGDVHTVEGLSILVWEVYGTGGPNPGTFYVHVIGWDPKGRQLSIEIASARYGGRPVALTGQEGGGDWGGPTTLLDLWFGVGVSNGIGPLTFEAQLVRYRNGGAEIVATVPFELAI